MMVSKLRVYPSVLPALAMPLIEDYRKRGIAGEAAKTEITRMLASAVAGL